MSERRSGGSWGNGAGKNVEGRVEMDGGGGGGEWFGDGSVHRRHFQCQETNQDGDNTEDVDQDEQSWRQYCMPYMLKLSVVAVMCPKLFAWP